VAEHPDASAPTPSGQGDSGYARDPRGIGFVSRREVQFDGILATRREPLPGRRFVDLRLYSGTSQYNATGLRHLIERLQEEADWAEGTYGRSRFVHDCVETGCADAKVRTLHHEMTEAERAQIDVAIVVKALADNVEAVDLTDVEADALHRVAHTTGLCSSTCEGDL
jgi:hypothetical protein